MKTTAHASRGTVATLLAAALVAVLATACDPMVDSPQPTPAPERSPVLSLRLSQDNSRGGAPLAHTFRDFDRQGAHQQRPREIRVPAGGRLYEGELATFDGIATRIYVQTAPRNAIDRVLVTINGGTGTDARHFLNNHGHKIVVVVSQRGLHTDDMRSECPLGAGLVACLRAASTQRLFRAFNPRDNGRDVADVLRIIAGELALTVAGQATPAAGFFAVGDRTVNLNTGSYGATILAYALQAFHGLPAGSAAKRNGIGRVFIEGPSAPYENVITDGFRNTRAALGHTLDALGLTAQQKNALLNAMKARHTAPVTDVGRCPVDPSGPVSADCLSSGMIWSWLARRYEAIAGTSSETARRTAMATLARELTAIPAAPAASGSALAAVAAIYGSSSLSAMDRTAKTWESKRLMLTGGGASVPQGRSYGFTSRIAQICSAYVLRADGDSQARFDAAKRDAANDPYWYGFLIGYREMLSICPQAAAAFQQGIVPPRSLGVAAEAVVQIAAGTDEKHHRVEMDEMAALFAASTRKIQVFLPEALQGGETPVQTQRGCLDALMTAAFTGNPADVRVPASCRA